MSAEELADMLNISVRHLYDIETGKVPLGEERIKKLCAYFNVTSDYLLGLTGNDGTSQKFKEVNDDDKFLEGMSLGALKTHGDINIKELKHIIKEAIKEAMAEREQQEDK